MDPYLRIGPFKIEELNEEPIVLIFHDFLTNVETYEIISRASSKLFISQTGFSRDTSKNMHLRLVACKVCKIITSHFQTKKFLSLVAGREKLIISHLWRVYILIFSPLGLLS